MTPARDLIQHMHDTPIIPNSLAIWGLGQIGMAIKGPEGIIYIDPCLSDVVRERLGDWWVRAYDPPLRPAQITNAACFLITHEHWDHLDPLTAGPAAKASPDAVFVAPGWCREALHELDIPDSRILAPPPLQSIPLPGTRARLTAVPAAHYGLDHDPQKGHRWLGYLIEWNGVTLYNAGDTVIYEGYIDALKALPTPDVAMLPVNGRDFFRESLGVLGNLWPAEAARLAHDLGWDVLLVGHNDMYPNNAIPLAEIAGAFERAAPRQKYRILQPGELFYYVK